MASICGSGEERDKRPVKVARTFSYSLLLEPYAMPLMLSRLWQGEGRGTLGDPTTADVGRDSKLVAENQAPSGWNAHPEHCSAISFSGWPSEHLLPATLSKHRAWGSWLLCLISCLLQGRWQGVA